MLILLTLLPPKSISELRKSNTKLIHKNKTVEEIKENIDIAKNVSKEMNKKFKILQNFY